MNDNTKRIDELAKKVKKGDKKAFEELYKLTSSRAYFTALQICNDKQEAEDILQESYITALNKISSLERTESFMSWFNRIVVNKTKDFLRKKNPKLLSEDDEWLLGNQEDDNEKFSPESNVDKEELKSVVMDAVGKLSLDKRTCVMMRYFNDMSVNDIAKTMDVPVSTVKNRLLAARRELKSLFENKGITAAYSVAPFGVVGWAYNAAFESVAQSFDGSAAAAKILSGIAVAGTAASAATAGSAATGTGVFAKLAAASSVQKVVSGLVVAGVVTGSTIGITTAVKNKNETSPDVAPTAAYTETVDYAVLPETDIPEVNIIQAEYDKKGETHKSKMIEFNTPGSMLAKVNYKGELKQGANHIDFEDEIDMYYVTFNAEESGYYSFTCDYNSPTDFCLVAVPEETQGNTISSFTLFAGNPGNGYVYYIKEGENTLIIEKSKLFDSEGSDIDVKYLGKELADIVIRQEDLDNVVLGYDEHTDDGLITWQDQSVIGEGLYGNYFHVKLVFTDGKEYDMGDCALPYRVKEGELKEGKNTAIFTFFGKEYEEEITVHHITEYVKDIEISNLEEFTFAEINEEGFIYEAPEEYEITVTYADGSKETFDGRTWDRFLHFDNGVKLYVSLYNSHIIKTMDYQLRSRQPLKFVVAIGDHIFIERICVITDFDVIGYRKALDKNNLQTAKEYYEVVKDFYKQAENDVDSIKDYSRYSYSLAENTVYYSLKLVKRIAGFELDYAITTYKIITENEFDLS